MRGRQGPSPTDPRGEGEAGPQPHCSVVIQLAQGATTKSIAEDRSEKGAFLFGGSPQSRCPRAFCQGGVRNGVWRRGRGRQKASGCSLAPEVSGSPACAVARRVLPALWPPLEHLRAPSEQWGSWTSGTLCFYGGS